MEVSEMLLKQCVAGLTLLLGGTAAVQAQERQTVPAPSKPTTAAVSSGTTPSTTDAYMLPEASKTNESPANQPPAAKEKTAHPAVSALAPEPLCPNLALEEAKWGPTPPEDVRLLMDSTVVADYLTPYGLKTFGWLDMGYTYSSTGHGPLTVEPRPNRFGNEFLLNQLYLALEKPLNENELSWGFRTDLFAGADATLLQPEGFLKLDPNNRFGFDIRQIYASAHLPILTDGGVDIKAGRQNTVIGYEMYAAPYRPFYSNDYQWFYSEDGSVFTGISANWHVTKQLDIYNAITQGFNTFFTNRSGGPTYLGQVSYWLQPEKETQLTLTLLMGPERDRSISTGDMTTIVELRVTQNWSPHLLQVVQSHMGWLEHGKSSGGYGQWYSLMNILVYHLTPHLDTNSRVEWYDDQDGATTGFRTAYVELTLGLDYHPHTWLSLRPEIRGDFADEGVFRGGKDHNQFTAAIDAILKF
jgi:hypothetical protein